MMRKSLLFLLCLLALAPAYGQTYRQLREAPAPVRPALQHADVVYSPTVCSVRLHPAGAPDALPIVPLPSLRQAPLLLGFDNLLPDPEYYEAKIIHCNADWEPSSVAAMDYLDDYNEFNINNFELSVNTRVGYVHYDFELPPVKRSGNYLLKVYQEGQEDDLVLTWRFVVYEDAVQVGFRPSELATGLLAQTHQLLELQVMYGALDLPRPEEQMKVAVLQNGRWDNARPRLRQAFVNPQQRVIDYRHPDQSATFPGGNEFRSFDLSDLENGGFQVGRIEQSDTLSQALLLLDKPRAGRVYDAMVRDRNGRYQPAVRQLPRPDTEADYVEVIFQLETGNPLPHPVHVLGAWNAWRPTEGNKMRYIASEGKYYVVQVMKQGFYDYLYWSAGPDPWAVEGSHRRTRNRYDVLVYYRELGSRGDRVVGYAVWEE
jgi:hypothetical protein